MKTKYLFTACFIILHSSFILSAHAQSTAFTYQGRLNDGANPANGKYDLTFALFKVANGAGQIGNTLTNSTTGVSNGLFMVTLDFGNQFPGANRWLEIAVRTNGGGAFATLNPRQPITATPYAITAGNLSGDLSSGSLSGPYTNAVTLNNGANSFSGNGAGLAALNASQLTSGTVPAAALANAWRIGGNAGTTPGTQFLGTTDNQPLELKVNNQRVLRLEPNGSSPNLIGGYAGNSIGAGSFGSVIAGGGYPGLINSMGNNATLSVIGGGYGNTIAANSAYAIIAGGSYNDIGTNSESSAIGGGYNNTIAAYSAYATISGGYLNDIGTNAPYSAIGGGNDNNIAPNSGGYASIAGGRLNSIGTNAPYSAIGGGSGNNIAADSWLATIAGGRSNDISTNSDYSAIGGGYGNIIAVNSEYATIPGGGSNAATSYAFAAGYRAKANHIGAFVWGDATFADIASSTANSVTMRASGGYWLFSNNQATTGVRLAAGDGSWTSISDRNAKENLVEVNPLEVLKGVAALPLSTWNYKSQDASIRHIGPMAQDFKAAFAVGDSDTGITTIDADGVALAAIQGLNQKMDSENAALRAENAELKQRLEKLEQRMNQKNGGAR